MIPLPRYVKPVLKKNGRIYYYFAKYRGTAEAWPWVRLPPNPLTEEFAARILLSERLVAKHNGQAWRWQFIDVTDRRHDLPAPADSEAFWIAVERAAEIGKQHQRGERKTFGALIVDFKNSAAYKDDISDATREQYDRYIKAIEEAWADDPVAELEPEDAQKAIDAYDDTPMAGRAFRATLSRLIGWGIPRGYRKDNPVLHTEKPESDGTYSPWPPEAFEIFFEHARIGLHLPVYSALFTGQRKVDVLKMTRPRSTAAEMPIIAQKTGALVPIQIHSEYRAIINAAKSDHVMLHLREDGEPWTYEGFKTAWGREMARAEFKLFREKRLVPHGLRKNAVNMLLEVGCSEALVASIVRMSEAMVRHYSLEVNRFRLARQAMKLLEDAWADHRQHVLGNVKRVG